VSSALSGMGQIGSWGRSQIPARQQHNGTSAFQALRVVNAVQPYLGSNASINPDNVRVVRVARELGVPRGDLVQGLQDLVAAGQFVKDGSSYRPLSNR